jgi:hypothetical protein
MISKIHIAHAKIFLIAVLFFAGAYGLAEANHAWGKYHWNLSTAQSLENPLTLGDNLTTAAWKNSLAGASSDWNESVLKNQVTAGTSNANCDPTLGQVEVCNGAYGPNGWLGIAQIWAYRGRDGHIAQAVVKLNDTYFALPQYAAPAWQVFVMCQEVGHTFGLDHQDEAFTNANLGTCMDYTNDPDGSILGQLSNEHPNAHDYEMLQSIYAHLNDTSTGGGKGKGGGNGGGKKPADVGASVTLNGPAEWGQAVAQDAQGRNSRYVRNLGSGIEVITHVLWAP